MQSKSSAPSQRGVSTGPRSRLFRTRGICAALFLTVAIILAPVAVVSAWVRTQLVDTDRFVATLGPLANDPVMQGFVADQMAQAVQESINPEELVAQAFAGLGSLPVPPRVHSAIGMLQGPAVLGLEQMIGQAALTMVESSQFSALWNTALEQTHGRAVTLLQGSPDTLVQLSKEGDLTLELGPVINLFRQQLAERGFPFSVGSSDLQVSVLILQSKALGEVRGLYHLAVAVGAWAPWVVIALGALGLALANHRRRTARRAVMVLFGVLAVVTAVVLALRGYGIGMASTAGLPEDVAAALLKQLLSGLVASLTALTALSGVVAVVMWWLHRLARLTRSGQKEIDVAVDSEARA